MRQLVKRLVSAKFFFAKFAIKLVPKNGPQEASLIFFGIILNNRIFDIWGKGRGEIKNQIHYCEFSHRYETD